MPRNNLPNSEHLSIAINELEKEIDAILSYIDEDYVNDISEFDETKIFKINENNRLQDEIFVA